VRLGGPVLEVFIPRELVHDTRPYAFTVIKTPLLGPFEFIRMAVELNLVTNVSFTFAASTYGSALLVDDPINRETLVQRSPLRFAGINVAFVRPEDTEDRGSTSYSLLVEVAITNFPLELRHHAGAAFILEHAGRFCCVDHSCFSSSDKSSMHGFVQIEASTTIVSLILN
jgi:hypothetical protein